MKMKAVVLTAHGGPEMLQLVTVDAPELSDPHDVLVRVHAAGVNPSDYKQRRESFDGYAVVEARSSNIPTGIGSIPPAGRILGLEGAGVVERTGTGVTRVRPGDEVYWVDGGFGPRPGNYSEFKLVHEDHLARKPKSLEMTAAGAAPTAVITAWEAVIDRITIEPGQFVLVHAGAGGVGHIALQLAKLRGAEVATTVSTDEKADLAKRLGADVIIRYRKQNVVDAVREWTGKPGADVVVDTVGGSNFAASLDQVAPYGTVVSSVESDWPAGNNYMTEFLNLHLAFENMGLPQIAQDSAARRRQTALLEAAADRFDSGELQLVMGASFPLAEAAEAHRVLEAGEVIGRVVLEID
jgi:NADPH2:quinone reductase